MQRTIMSVMLALLLVGCQQAVEKNNSESTVNFSRSYSPDSCFRFKASFIPLETSDSCLLGHIAKVEEVKQGFVVLDIYSNRCVFLFDRKGRYVSTIGKCGTAPGEYVLPLSFCISPDESQIAILDGDRNFVLYYSLTDFTFLGEKRIPFHAAGMEYLSSDEIVWMNRGESPGYLLLKTDLDLNIQDSLIKRDFYSPFSVGTNPRLYRTRQHVGCYTSFSPVLYQIEGDKIVKTNFLFGDAEFPPLSYIEEESKKNKGNYVPALQKSSYISYFSIREAGGVYCVPFFVKGKMYYGFYDSQLNASFKITPKEIQQVLGIGSYSAPVGTTFDGRFISLLNPDMERDHSEQGGTVHDELKSVLAAGKEGDNPILMLLAIEREE